MKNKLENVFIKVGDATPSKIKNYFESRGVNTRLLKCESTNANLCFGVLNGTFNMFDYQTRKHQGGIFVIPMELEGTFIKCGTATPEQIRKYFASRGIETHPYDLMCHAKDKCYGVFEGSFGIFSVDYVSKFDAEFIELPKETHAMDLTFVSCLDATQEQLKEYFSKSGLPTKYEFSCVNANWCYGIYDGAIHLTTIGKAKSLGGKFIDLNKTQKAHPLHNKFIVCGTATKEQLKEYFRKSGIHSSLTFSINNNSFCYGIYENNIVLLGVGQATKLGGEFITIEEEKPKQSTYYYLMASNGGKPNRKHQTIESAREEAKRILLTDASQKSVEILQCVEVFKIEKSVSRESLVEGGCNE